LLQIGYKQNTGIFADAYQGKALYRHQTLIRGRNTFSFTCAMRYFKPLIINQVTELTWLCYDLCLFVTDRLQKNKGIFADAYQGLALYRHQTLIRGFNTFNFTCAVRYFQHLIINQVTKLTWLCFDLCLFCCR